MKIQALLEAKFSPTNYAYHATMGENLRSILKHGLIPNKRDDGYGSDDSGLAFGYSLTPLKGIYFTRKRADAETIAKHIDLNALIIICKIQPQDMELDEDRLTGDIVDEDYLARKFRRSTAEIYDKEEITDEYLTKFSQDYAQDIIKKQFDNLDHRLLASIYGDLVTYIKVLLQYHLDADMGSFDETDIKKYQTILTKKLRTLVKSNKSTNHTFKINKTLTFSGANKIVGIYNPSSKVGWGQLGDFEGYAYHKVNDPNKLSPKNH